MANTSPTPINPKKRRTPRMPKTRSRTPLSRLRYIMPMDMERVRDRTVGVVLADPQGLTFAGHKKSVHGGNFFAKVVGFDAFGIWFESALNKVLTHVYFPWSSIRSIIYFPQAGDVDVAPKEKFLGFGFHVSGGMPKPQSLPTVKKTKPVNNSKAKKKK